MHPIMWSLELAFDSCEAIYNMFRRWFSGSNRAKKLLCQHLTLKQRRHLKIFGWFEVRGSNGGKYRIHEFMYNNVNRYAKNETLCAHIQHDYSCPLHDHILAQKLMLEADEEGFRRISRINGLPYEQRIVLERNYFAASSGGNGGGEIVSYYSAAHDMTVIIRTSPRA